MQIPRREWRVNIYVIYVPERNIFATPWVQSQHLWSPLEYHRHPVSAQSASTQRSGISIAPRGQRQRKGSAMKYHCCPVNAESSSTQHFGISSPLKNTEIAKAQCSGKLSPPWQCKVNLYEVLWNIIAAPWVQIQHLQSAMDYHRCLESAKLVSTQRSAILSPHRECRVSVNAVHWNIIAVSWVWSQHLRSALKYHHCLKSEESAKMQGSGISVNAVPPRECRISTYAVK